MIGNQVEHQAQAAFAERGGEGLQVRLRANLGVELREIAHVVAVGAAGPGLEQGRGVHVTDAQRLQVRHQCRGLPEREAAMELEPVRGARCAAALLHDRMSVHSVPESPKLLLRGPDLNKDRCGISCGVSDLRYQPGSIGV